MMQKNSQELSKTDYNFMHSVGAAFLQTAPHRMRTVLYFWIITMVAFFLWANFAMIDEIARGEGEIIPSGENQVIQNLEGGIVEAIYVKEGDTVAKDQVLLKIDNSKSQSSFSSSEVKIRALKAKVARLKAESSNKSLHIDNALKKNIPVIVDNEINLYKLNKQQFHAELDALQAKLEQKKQELKEAKTQLSHLKSSYQMISKEVAITKPMVIKGVRSKIDFLKLQREANEIESKYKTTKDSIPRLHAAIKEVQKNIQQAEFMFQSEAKEKLNEALAELKTLQSTSTALKDEVSRTTVKSPMNGIVQKLHVHTIGGVIKPGMDIMEIVPTDEKLLVNVRVKPSDIAFIYYGQKAKVKISAYDFSIYGGLDGKVVVISPDTQQDEKGNVFYTVRILTDKNYLERNSKKLKIIPGMTVTVDIITGKKSVLDYILKPILKTKQYTFTER